jgi:hypothetical protein
VPERKQFGRYVPRLKRTEAHSWNVGSAEDSLDEMVREECRYQVAAPGAELCASDDDLVGPRATSGFDLGYYGINGAGLLTPASPRDNAEGTDVVAALLRPDKCAGPERRGLFRRGGDARQRRPAHQEVDQSRAVVLAHARHEVRSERANRLRAGRTRKTAGNRDRSIRGEAPGGAHQTPRPGISDVSDRAGVEDKGVGFTETVDHCEAGQLERPGNFLAVGEVELAAEGDHRRERTMGHGPMVSGSGCPVQVARADRPLKRPMQTRTVVPPVRAGSAKDGGIEMSMDAQAAIEAAEAAAKGTGATIVERLASRLGVRAEAEAVFGAPVEREGVTVIPVARVRTGFGGGGGTGPAGKGEGGGGGVSASALGYIEMTEGRADFRPIFDPAAYTGLVMAAGISAWLTFRGLRSLFR